MLQDMEIRNFSRNTQLSYLQHVSSFAKYFQRSPEVLGPDEVRTSQVHVTTERKLAPGSLSIIASALRFLYKVTLKRDWVDAEIPLPKAPFRLPVILSPDEVIHLLESVASRVAAAIVRSPAAARSVRHLAVQSTLAPSILAEAAHPSCRDPIPAPRSGCGFAPLLSRQRGSLPRSMSTVSNQLNANTGLRKPINHGCVSTQPTPCTRSL
jgi:hypothetical protein